MAEILLRSEWPRGPVIAEQPPGERQQTLAEPVRCSGVGLHTGTAVEMTFRPADVGTGIVFRRADLEGAAALVAARWDSVSETRLCTTLSNRHGVSIRTVEHVMAALAACGLDNVLVEIDGPEPPIMDGSAIQFIGLLRQAGSVGQGARRAALKIRKAIAVGDKRRFACLFPAEEFSVECEIDFESRAIGRQSCRYVAGDDFARDVAPARTFGFLQEVDALRRMGLALGGSLENAVVIDGDRVLNESGLRFSDEFARHKVLDAVGDLYLAGAPIIGRFRGYQSGHQTNHALLCALFRDGSAWTWEHSGGPVASDEFGRSRPI